jgi:hypothetical protein
MPGNSYSESLYKKIYVQELYIIIYILLNLTGILYIFTKMKYGEREKLLPSLHLVQKHILN